MNRLSLTSAHVRGDYIDTPLGNTPHAHVGGDLVPLAQSDNSPWKEPTSVPYSEH